MNLSTAIRKGAEQHPQCFNSAFRTDGFNNIVKTCAIGSVYIGLLGNITAEEFRRMQYDDIKQHFPLLTKVVECPECKRLGKLGEIIASHLNDTHYWSREKIADWVETVEIRLNETING